MPKFVKWLHGRATCSRKYVHLVVAGLQLRHPRRPKVSRPPASGISSEGNAPIPRSRSSARELPASTLCELTGIVQAAEGTSRDAPRPVASPAAAVKQNCGT